MRICLYTAITSQRENEPTDRALWRSFKDSIKRYRDQVRWLLDIDREFDFNAWAKCTGTNRGDMAIRHAARRLLSEALEGDIQFFECGWGNLDQDTVDEINLTCNIFVISGGGYLHIEDDGALGNRRLEIDNEYLQKISCPKIAYAVGLNQVLSHGSTLPIRYNAAATQTVKAWLGCLDLVSVRDEATRDLLQKIDRRSIYMIGDPALFLTHETPSHYKTKQIGINFAVHGPLSQALFSKHFHQYRSMLMDLQNAGFHLTYFQHSDTDAVAVRMLRREGIQFAVADASPLDIPSAYARMEFVICQMLHSAILATSVGVPSICIAYDRKNFAFHDLIGMPEFCIHHDKFTLEWLWRRVEEIQLNRSTISASLAHQKGQLLERHHAFLQLMRGILVRD